MPDQITLDLIKDPSLLKPAEDALKALSRASQDALDGFNKANEAAAKFAGSARDGGRAAKDLGDGAHSAGRALQGIEAHTGGSITAISKLNAVISAGAVRAVVDDFRQWGTEMTSLTGKNNALRTDLSALTQSEIGNIAKRTQAAQGGYDLDFRNFMALMGKKKKAAADLDKAITDGDKKTNAQLTADEKKVAEFLIQSARQVSDAIFENQQQKRENSLTAAMENLDAQKNAELLNTTLTASQRNAVEKKFKAEEAQAKLKAWKADQKAKEEQALINGLLAFTTSMAEQGYPVGLITGALALATAGIQAGIIASKTPPKFAAGTPGSMVTPPGMKWVGERGPELIYTPGGEKIMTSEHSMALLRQYQIPAVNPGLGALLDGTGVTLHGQIGTKELVHEIRNLKSEIKNLNQVHVSIDEKGYRLSLERSGSRTEYLNQKGKL